VEDPVLTLRKKAADQRAFPFRLAIVAGAALVVLLLGWAVGSFLGGGPAAKQGEQTVVVVPPGAGLSRIATILSDAGVVRSADAFKAIASAGGNAGKLKAGEYAIPSRASPAKIIDILTSGKSIQHAVTIPEGWTSAMVMRALAEAEFLDGPLPPTPPEGSLLPETYMVTRGTSRAAILAKMTDAHDKTLAQLWEKRALDVPVRTPQEAVILASIVEKETGQKDERERVAGVFSNRLRIGMRLESDPTIIYGLTRGEPLGRGIRQSELIAFTPWNTYLIPALPPTPIANPGRESLAAVMNPARTNELFFVADGTGGHVFAATYAEHLKNVEQWRAVEARRAEEAKAGN